MNLKGKSFLKLLDFQCQKTIFISCVGVPYFFQFSDHTLHVQCPPGLFVKYYEANRPVRRRTEASADAVSSSMTMYADTPC